MPSKYQYGVVLDAGSSGTRIYVYRWYKNAVARATATPEALHQLPNIQTKAKWSKKVHPGMSTFADRPDEVGKGHLKDLFEHALDIVPEDEVANTPIFLLATAGMRLVPEMARKQLLAEVCSYVQKKTDFALTDCDANIQVIAGETEGLYGWIASNYLVGAFGKHVDHANGRDHDTYGFLDMGGASAQIAFAPNVTEAEKHANDLRLLRLRTVDGQQSEYRVFVTTWLGYGANEARRRYVDALLEAFDTTETNVLPDPCLPKGLQIHKNGTSITSNLNDQSEATLIGTGRFSECLAQTFPLLDKDAACADPPCLFHGVHVPAIDFDINHFIGVSEFWHSTHEIFEMDKDDKAFDFRTYQARVTDFCSQDWSKIVHGIEDEQWGKKVDEQKAAESCFKASWIINMLHEGIGIPRIGIETSEAHASSEAHDTTKELLEGAEEAGFSDSLPLFQALNKVEDVEISWTLGKMVLYASSMVPPSNAAIEAVGFGSNIPGIAVPNDWKYPGGTPDLSVLPGGAMPWDMKSFGDDDADDTDDDTDDDDDDDDQWTSKLLHGDDFSDRAPGLILIFLILLLVAFFLCGRERRQNILRKLNPFHKRDTGRFEHDSASSSLPRTLLNKLGLHFGKDKSPKYERVMEEGNSHDFIPKSEDFELHGMPSSSSGSDDEDSRSLSSRGSAGRKAKTTDDRPSSMARSASSTSLGVDTALSGRRSRAASPRRMTPLEEAD